MKPYPHQITGVEWLASRHRAALLDEQGLGKTITAILAADRVGAERVLIVAPSVVVWNWAKEFELWSPKFKLRTPAHRIQVVSKGGTRIDTRPGVTIVTHGLLLRPNILMQLLVASWDLIVLDESHFFRSRTAKRTRVFYGVWGRNDVRSLVSRARYVWCLTGTPMPNNASELWSMVWGLDPERVRLPGYPPMSFEAFRDRFCRTTWTQYGDGVKVIGNRNVAELRKRLDGLCLRRRKADHLDLPPVRREQIVLRPDRLPTELEKLDAELTPAVRAAVRRADSPAAGFDVLGDSVELARYRRLCGIAKAEPAAELLAMELEGGAQKVVVFAHHRDVIETLYINLQRFGIVRITGGTLARARQLAVDRFQSDPKVRVIVCQIVAGGTGTTLTASAEVVFVELSYVPGENAQAADRIHRIGQTADHVRVRFIALAGTADELIVSTLRRKTRMIREVLK